MRHCEIPGSVEDLSRRALRSRRYRFAMSPMLRSNVLPSRIACPGRMRERDVDDGLNAVLAKRHVFLDGFVHRHSHAAKEEGRDPACPSSNTYSTEHGPHGECTGGGGGSRSTGEGCGSEGDGAHAVEHGECAGGDVRLRSGRGVGGCGGCGSLAGAASGRQRVREQLWWHGGVGDGEDGGRRRDEARG